MLDGEIWHVDDSLDLVTRKMNHILEAFDWIVVSTDHCMIIPQPQNIVSLISNDFSKTC